jgi:methionine-rich copper-binding protein CopC
MDHDTAIQTNASERYVARDLSSSEREEFEEHFSDCTRCMDDVSMASIFAANARAVFRDRALARPASRSAAWLDWLFARPLPAFAAMAFAVFIGYQNLMVIPGMKAPRSVVASVSLDGETRAALPQVHAGEALRVQMPFDQAAAAGKLTAELTDTLGNRLSRGPVAAPQANQPLDLYFPVKLMPGRYTVVVRAEQPGRPPQELARSSFEVTSQETKVP